MGIIQRQGIKSSLVNFFGVGIGVVATLFIYPLDLAAKGLFDYIFNLSVLFLPYAQFGLIAVYLKYFPKFKNNIGEFQTLLLKKLLRYYLLFCIIFFIVRKPLGNLFQYFEIVSENNFETYSLYVPFLVLLILSQSFLVAIADSNKRIVVPDLIRNTIVKIYIPIIVFLKFLLHFDNHFFVLLIFVNYIITVPLLYWYCKSNGFIKIKWKSTFKIPDNLKKEIRSYNILSVLNEISNQLVFSIDTVMVGSFIGFVSTGIYSSMIYLSNTLSIPAISILRVSAPIVSEHMSNGNIDEVESIYKKVSISLFIFGTMFFAMVGFMINDLLSLTKYSEQLKIGLSVFIFISVGRLFDMITSINTHILIYSKYYRYNLILIVFLGINNIILNLKLIPLYGIAGAALATLISSLIYNVIKLLLIYWKFKIHPFSVNTIKVFLISVVMFGILFFISNYLDFNNVMLTIVVKGIVLSVVILLVYIVPLYIFKVSIDFNQLINNTLSKVKLKNKI